MFWLHASRHNQRCCRSSNGSPWLQGCWVYPPASNPIPSCNMGWVSRINKRAILQTKIHGKHQSTRKDWKLSWREDCRVLPLSVHYNHYETDCTTRKQTFIWPALPLNTSLGQVDVSAHVTTPGTKTACRFCMLWSAERFLNLKVRLHWSQNRQNTANQHLSGYTLQERVAYI